MTSEIEPRIINQALSIEEKRKKIASNYETIKVLKNKLEEDRSQQKVGMTRAAYIKMIFDATKKVNKQNEELNKVILETRRLQKDIGNLSGRLGRSFALVEDTILKVCCYLRYIFIMYAFIFTHTAILTNCYYQ